MATKKPSSSRALANWDEELAKQAEIAAGMEESTASGAFFSVKSGQLTWNDAPVKDNMMAVIIVDAILENVYYEGTYDPDAISAPICFAFGRDEKTMTPHKNVWEAGDQQCGASKLCEGCEMNEFGTALIGKGKACKNTRRLALIPAGVFNNGKFELLDDPEQYEHAQLGFMKLPVTSVKGYSSFVKQLAGALRRPAHGVITKVYVVPSTKNQFEVKFEAIMKVPDNLMGVIMKRHEEAKSVIDFPYKAFEEDDQPKRGSRAAKKPVSRARKY